MSAYTIDGLQGRIRGRVNTPGDEGYDEVRTVYNAHARRAEAGGALQAVDDADVIATVEHAAERDVPVALRSGGHSVPGYGTCDDGVVVDLSAIRNVRVDPERRRARGGGALLGDLDHASYPFGLLPAGFFSTTGVGGLSVGSGDKARVALGGSRVPELSARRKMLDLAPSPSYTGSAPASTPISTTM